MSDSNNNNNTNSTTPSSNEPSMLAGHLKYVQGAVASTLGFESGEQTKQSAIQEMREAKSDEPPKTSNLLGEVENVAGKVVGCPGMSEEGEARKPGVGHL